MRLFRRIDNPDRGATMVEYGLIVGVISLMSLSAVTLLGDSTSDSFDKVTAALDNGSTSTQVDSGSEQNGGSGSAGSGTTTTTVPEMTTTTVPETTTTTVPETTTTTAPTTTTTAPEEHGSSATVKGTDSDFTWWNNTKFGGNGEWKAEVTYTNDWIRHQYLTLDVTEVDEKGKKTTTTVKNFYVPAGGSSTFAHWGNDLSEKWGKVKGVVEVRVEVKSIRTSDKNWKPVTYEVNGGKVAKVSAPDTP
jgi:Flp pilus assembly pilin Flp